MSMCSASQPSFLAAALPRRSARHFFPSRELPPYPDPKLYSILMAASYERKGKESRCFLPREAIKINSQSPFFNIETTFL
jgi:hypothetical protein